MTSTPTSKMTAAGLAGGVAVIVAWALREFLRIDLPPEVSAALATLLAFGAGYVTTERRPASGPQEPPAP
jgi:putative flippase GtrA